MKPQHDAEHEGILAAILTGELEREVALAGTQVRNCRECLEVLDELEALRDELEDKGLLAPRAPEVNHLWPLMTQSSPSGSARVCSRVGSEPATSGSVMEKQERVVPSQRGRR